MAALVAIFAFWAEGTLSRREGSGDDIVLFRKISRFSLKSSYFSRLMGFSTADIVGFPKNHFKSEA